MNAECDVTLRLFAVMVHAPGCSRRMHRRDRAGRRAQCSNQPSEYAATEGYACKRAMPVGAGAKEAAPINIHATDRQIDAFTAAPDAQGLTTPAAPSPNFPGLGRRADYADE